MMLLLGVAIIDDDDDDPMLRGETKTPATLLGNDGAKALVPPIIENKDRIVLIMDCFIIILGT